MNTLAQNLIIQPGGGANATTITGPVAFNSLGDLISSLMVFILPLAGVVLFLIIMWGGYDFLMSGGEEKRIAMGKQKITTAVIGFILLVLSYVMAKFLGQIFIGGSGFF